MTLLNVNNTPLRPFDPMVLDCLGEISQAILTSPVGRQFPDLTAFAFYIRKGNVQKLADSFKSNEVRLGRGFCFHIAPANIPVNFAFTWIFSLLAGNANVVRIPSKDFPQVSALLAIINSALEKYPELKSRNVFVKYPRTDNETTAGYSAIADCRMIWGGDRTIAAVKALPVKPRCIDIAFADRYSVALINASAILAADDAAIAKLAENFYNDTYLMDQNACSSPQVILWEVGPALRSLGEGGKLGLPSVALAKEGSGEVETAGRGIVEKAQERFWTAVEAVARKKYTLQDAVAVDKYTLMCEEAVKNPAIKRFSHVDNLLYRAELVSLPDDLVEHRGKGGFFFEYVLRDRAEFFNLVTEKFQTITQFGLEVDELRRQIVESGLRGIDRIVPIGQAMNIGVVWDGYDLICALSRIIQNYV